MDALEREARKRVKAEKDFYSHLSIFLVVNAFLIALNLLASPGYLWFIWPLLGWGLGLTSHFVQTFGFFGLFDGEWEEQKVREYMLRREDRLTAAKVKELMHEELRAEESHRAVDINRLLSRIENLEAIVTSVDWDHVESRPARERTLDGSVVMSPEPSEGPLLEIDPSAEARVRRLSDRVR